MKPYKDIQYGWYASRFIIALHVKCSIFLLALTWPHCPLPHFVVSIICNQPALPFQNWCRCRRIKSEAKSILIYSTYFYLSYIIYTYSYKSYIFRSQKNERQMKTKRGYELRCAGQKSIIKTQADNKPGDDLGRFEVLHRSWASIS